MWVKKYRDGDSAAVLVPKASHPGLQGPGCKWPLRGLRESSHVHTGLLAAHPGVSRPQTLQGPVCEPRPSFRTSSHLPENLDSLGNPGQRVSVRPVPSLCIFQVRMSCDSPFAPPTPWTVLFANTLGFRAHEDPPILTQHRTQVKHRLRTGSFPSGNLNALPQCYATLGPVWSQASESFLCGATLGP